MVPLIKTTKSKRRQREIKALCDAAELKLGMEATNDEVLAFLIGRRCKVDAADILAARGVDRGYLCPFCSTELVCTNCNQPADYGCVKAGPPLLDHTSLDNVAAALVGHPYDTIRMAIKALERLR